jgi:hypothetical protein
MSSSDLDLFNTKEVLPSGCLVEGTYSNLVAADTFCTGGIIDDKCVMDASLSQNMPYWRGFDALVTEN